MSKAIEWAAKGDLAEFPKPEFVHWINHPMEYASVYQYGDTASLVISYSTWRLSPQGAIALARWIIDTFGEP